MCKHAFWGARGHGIVVDGVNNHMGILCRAISPIIVCGDETHISNPSASTWGGFRGPCVHGFAPVGSLYGGNPVVLHALDESTENFEGQQLLICLTKYYPC